MEKGSEKEIIVEVLRGNLSLYEKLVKKYQNMIYRNTYKILKNPDQAEDVTQETFIKAFENLKKLIWKNRLNHGSTKFPPTPTI